MPHRLSPPATVPVGPAGQTPTPTPTKLILRNTYTKAPMDSMYIDPHGVILTEMNKVGASRLIPPMGTRVFSNILTGAGPPQQPHGEDMPGQGPRPRAAGTQNLAASLHQILNMLAPGNGQFGDAVYTQEALDRIISNMMETNPQSNAAPPASEDAIGKLQRKAVDDDMLGPEGTAECTICIDELKKGEEVWADEVIAKRVE
ncbi:hypothetical protein ACHAQG_000515 [Verticillium nonalfalfae]